MLIDSKKIEKAVLKTYSTMLMMELIPTDDSSNVSTELSAVISFTGDFTANIAMHLSMDTAKQAVHLLVGEDVDDNSVYDGVGELINMIAGNTKADITDGVVSISLPEIIKGDNYSIEFRNFKSKESLYFNSEIGKITFEVAFG